MKQLGLLTVIVFSAEAWAGNHCDCQRSMIHSPALHGSVISAGPVATGRVTMVSPAPMVAPPPGTLGETYTRVSHPIPVDEHPRSAMLAVRDQEAVKYLRVQRMGGFRMNNGIWLFEASRPLVFGQDHVVRVEARHDKADVQPFKVKFVRLIPGRIVYLDF